MADPIYRKLREIIRSVLDEERAAKKKGDKSGIKPEDIAIKSLVKIFAEPADPALVKLLPKCDELLPNHPLIYALCKYDAEQITRAEFRRRPDLSSTDDDDDDHDGVAGGSSGGCADDDGIIEPTLPGFEEIAKKYKNLHPEYPKAHKKGQKAAYVPFMVIEEEDWIWNVRFNRGLLAGEAAHVDDLVAAGLEVHGYKDPDKKPDEPSKADIG